WVFTSTNPQFCGSFLAVSISTSRIWSIACLQPATECLLTNATVTGWTSGGRKTSSWRRTSSPCIATSLTLDRLQTLNTWRVPFADTDIGPDELRAVAEVVQSRWLTMGPKTEQFEQEFAALHGAPHAIAVSSCTAALHLAYTALGIGSGDEVIMPAMTFVATANAAVVCGARPVFADIISEDEPTIDPRHLESLITPRTRAIAAVHYAGYACRMDKILEVAERHHLPVVEDCAHAPLVRYGVSHLGSLGAIGCFSFFSNKNMTTGEGGMAVTRDEKLAARIRVLRSHGMTSGTWARHNERPADYDVLQPGW